MTRFAAGVPSPRRRQAYGGLLCAAAAVLTLVGSFQTAFSISYEFPAAGAGGGFAITSWGMREEEDLQVFGEIGDFVATTGVPLTMAAALLLAAAVLGIRAANARVTRAALVGAAFLAGVVGAFGMQLIAWQDVWTKTLPRATGLTVDTSVGPGFWLPVAAVVLAVVAVMLTGRAGPREEPDTPVLGIPVVTRLPDEPVPDN